MTEHDIVNMARASGLSHPEMTAEGNEVSIGRMTRFAEMVAAVEREACAKICEALHAEWQWSSGPNDCARDIRKRPNF